MKPIDAIHAERERIHTLHQRLSEAVAHADSAGWRFRLLPSSPPIINADPLDDARQLSWVLGMDWICYHPGTPLDTLPRPAWSCTCLRSDWRLEHLAILCGAHDSLSQARKNGWQGPIPRDGFRRRGKGTALWRITVLPAAT